MNKTTLPDPGKNMFISQKRALELVENFETPLYVYDENTLRLRCREMKHLLPFENFKVNYSAKANTNLELLTIICSEGIDVDAMSPGEICVQEKAGFPQDRIFYIGNNVSKEEMLFAIKKNILVSVDSLSQLAMFGKINPGGKVAVRFNPGIGFGHHEKVVTAGKKTKFGVMGDAVAEVKEIVSHYNLTLAGINQHLGSQLLEDDVYIHGATSLLAIAKQFSSLSFVDLGGGFGVPYKPYDKRLDLRKLSKKLIPLLNEFISNYDNKSVIIKVEPGRYIVAESGLLLGEVHSTKVNYGTRYIGTDIGFNVLARPVMYDSHHEIDVIPRNGRAGNQQEKVTIVGNICESGDIIAKERLLPEIHEGDIIAVHHAGAYGYAMSSNYNCRLRPAEVLVTQDGTVKIIRRRETVDDLLLLF